MVLHGFIMIYLNLHVRTVLPGKHITTGQKSPETAVKQLRAFDMEYRGFEHQKLKNKHL